MDEPDKTSNENSAPAPVAESVSRSVRRFRRRHAFIATGVLALLFALFGALVASIFYAAGTVGGSAWLLARLSAAGIGVQVVEPEGVLLGDLKAKQVIVTAGRTRVVIDRPAWQGAKLRYESLTGTWAVITVKALSANRVTITTTQQVSDGKPFVLPQRLRLPLELQIDDVRAGEVIVPGMDDKPFRDARAKLHLGAERGSLHRIDSISFALDPLLITGHLRIGAESPLPLDVDLQAVQNNTSGNTTGAGLPTWAKALRSGWQAQLKANGPLARFDAQAQLRASKQSLDATAKVAPAERWPLPELNAKTQGLDLSALSDKAPLTALSGTVNIAPAGNGTPAGTLAIDALLDNAKPGRLNGHQLPIRKLDVAARWRAGEAQRLELTRVNTEFADERSAAGTLQGTAKWDAGEFAVDALIAKLQPSLLDGRLAAMSLSGPIKLSGKFTPAPPAAASAPSQFRPPNFTALAELSGQLVNPPRPVQLRLDAVGSAERIELRELRASAGEAKAQLSGTAERAGANTNEGAWNLKAKTSLVDFDPRPWFPIGPGGGWQNGDHRFNLNGDAALTVPDSLQTTGPDDKRTLLERVAGLRGEAVVRADKSVIGGTPLTGDVSWKRARTGEPMVALANLDIGGNVIKLDSQVASGNDGAKDRWSLTANAPALNRVAPLLQLLLPTSKASELTANLSGSLQAEAQASGRWPAISTEGKANLNAVRSGSWAVGQGQARWQVGSTANAPLDVQVDIGQAAWAQKQIVNTMLQLKGSAAQHDINLRSELRAAPPVWMESMQGGGRVVVMPATAASAASAPTRTTAAQEQSASAPARTLAVANARGSLSGGVLAGAPSRGQQALPWAWKGVLQQIELRTTQAGALPLLAIKDVGIEYNGGPQARVAVTEGRADILGAGLRWNRIDWQAGRGIQAQQLDMQADLEPLMVAPLLRRIQPNFGWGGDLQIAGKVVIRQTDAFKADIVLERTRGDLTVTEESGTRSLGLSDLRVALDASDGTWNFTVGAAGEKLGVLGGALVVRTSPQAAWPAPDAPVQGVVEARVANLGTWGAWVPAGWRLDGQLNVSASFGGRFGAPEYTGSVVGSGIGVRNMVEGVNVTDGEVDISLRGDTAKINKLTAKGGAGTVRMEGDAKLDDTWRARLKIVADKFQALGRVDLRIVTSGQGQVNIDGEDIKADGNFTVDEGLIDFTRLSSPSLGDDVVVTGRNNDPNDQPPAAPNAANNRMSLDLTVKLGDRMYMRGLGIDTRLRGELHVSRPAGKWALQGTVNAVEGTFANYGQKLVIDRGIVTFNGAPSNMRLDIEATRPNLDVRVGVAVSGPLQNLRVRLFSDPEMTNNEKLSWLLLGRASDGLGKTDTALVQRAAFALLAGDGDGGPGAITKKFGIDDVGLRQTEGDSRETVVSVGKQLSKRVYIAYEQNLATSAGSFQVTYRIAQRFVMRLQSGLDRSVDFIGTWRWE